jgi:hypothetical protein
VLGKPGGRVAENLIHPGRRARIDAAAIHGGSRCGYAVMPQRGVRVPAESRYACRRSGVRHAPAGYSGEHNAKLTVRTT